MKISVDVRGIESVKAALAGKQKQVRFAAAKALTQTAYAITRDLQDEMKQGIAGGPTPYTLRAWKVTAANKENLQAVVALRTDGPAGGTPYIKALGHLFEGGRRDWKKIEGLLRSRKILPAGQMIVPGPKAPLDSRGNFKRRNLDEMIGILSSQLTNLRVHRQSGRGKFIKSLGFFVCRPGDRSGLTPGIWRRIDTGNRGGGTRGGHASSAIEPWIMFINPASYRKKFDIERIAKRTVDINFQKNFNNALVDALRTAR